jgi:hypothetical protein
MHISATFSQFLDAIGRTRTSSSTRTQAFIYRHFLQLHDSLIIHVVACLLDDIGRRPQLTSARTVQSYACL